MATEVLILDISAWQTSVDWLAVKKAGVNAVYIKETEGDHIVDSYFLKHWQEAKAAGVRRGSYEFFHPDQDVAKQADLFLTKLDHYEPTDLPCVMDWETTGGTPDYVDREAGLIYLDLIERATGKTPMIYGSASFLSALKLDSRFAHYALWVAAYGPKTPPVPAPWTDWKMWQFTDASTIFGLKCDMSYFNGTAEELSKF